MDNVIEFCFGSVKYLNESDSWAVRFVYRLTMAVGHLCLFCLIIFLGWLACRMVLPLPGNVFQDLREWLEPRISGISQSYADLFIFAAFLCGLSAYNWREKAPLGYGSVEVLIGTEAIAIAFVIFISADREKADSAGVAFMLSLIGGVYIIVRGLDNIAKATKQKDQKKKDEDEVALLTRIERSAAMAAEAALHSAEASKSFAEAAKLAIASRMGR